MSRLRAGTALALGVSMTLLAACGSTGASTNSTAPGGKVTLTWWHTALLTRS